MRRIGLAFVIICLTFALASVTSPASATVINGPAPGFNGGTVTNGITAPSFTTTTGGVTLPTGQALILGTTSLVQAALNTISVNATTFNAGSSAVSAASVLSSSFVRSGEIGLAYLTGGQPGFCDLTGTPGSGTCSTGIGAFSIAAAGTTATIAVGSGNNIIMPTSFVMLTPQTNDATCTRFAVTRASGSFTVTANAACTAAAPIAFIVVKS